MFSLILKWLFIKSNHKIIKSSQTDRTIYVSNIYESIDIRIDKNGIPHIYAETINDLMFAQGYSHAKDRLWQMEMNRRVAMGTLSEAFGIDALDTDRLIRTLGFNKLAEQDYRNSTPNTQKLLQQYSNGVNAFIQSSKLPVEFKLSGIKPIEWIPIHSIGWGRVMSWTLSHGWSGALTRQEIIDKIGYEKASELELFYPDDNPVELPDGIEFNALEVDSFMESMKGPFLSKDMDGGGRGSNAWAVSSNKSETGRPILCNDTHLVLTTPSVWYVNHLISNNGYHVTGASLPGVPGVLIGHNENISWGITLAFTDVEDIFIEKVDVETNTYEYLGNNVDINSRKEIINIKNSDTHTEEIRSTIHGPLIGSVTNRNDLDIALASKALDPLCMVDAIWKMNIAKDHSDFTEAIKLLSAPHLNIVYADTQDNIGLFISGTVPIRKKGNGQLPVHGWNGEYDWIGTIPFEEMPKSLNPKKGYIISCNNKVIKDDYPYFLSNSYMNGYRANRIESIFNSQERISIEICKSLHLDVFSIPGKTFIEGMIKGFKSNKPKVNKLLSILHKWNFQLDTESVGATVFQVMMYYINRNLVEEELGSDLTDKYLGKGEHPLLIPTSELLGNNTQILYNILQNPHSQWINSDMGIITLIEKSIIDACKWLENEVSYEVEDWLWGDIHKVQFRHSMSIKPPLDKVFNVGPYRIGGDTDTVCQTAFNPTSPFHPTEWCPSIRFIFDVGEWDNGLVISPPGQSGILGSAHYDDMAKLWIKGNYVPLYWSEEKIIENTETIITLNPE